MRKAEYGNARMVEVIPDFNGAPTNWIQRFDNYEHVQTRYPIPDRAGMVEVLVEPAVKTVLFEIKRMPARRVGGQRAEAFIRNPFALLGEDASKVLSEEEFERAREEAGIYFNRFTVDVVRDETGICGASLLIESSIKDATTETYRFKSPDDLQDFIDELKDKLSQGMQCCAWQGWDLELLGDAEDQLRTLREVLKGWHSRPLILFSKVYDLSRYSKAIKEIGHEKPYYSPYIAKQREDEGRFPDNATLGFFWTPEGSTEPIAISLDPKEIDKFGDDIDKAKSEGKQGVDVPGCPKPIPISEAEDVLRNIKEALNDVKAKTFPRPATDDNEEYKKPPSLVLKPNIERVEHSEERRLALARDPNLLPRLPNALKREFKLLDHQLKGVAWLQHLWENAPTSCRGGMLADDMGLGKTLQLLTFIAACFEHNPELEPALVVAPVSLLENWKHEIEKFFERGTFKIETLYDQGLRDKKLGRDQIDPKLLTEGLTRFLKPDWRDNANLVLTTYETLRDHEFSFASERWSIMICDEAKIKNPNALVTRAAKKQNVRFKIACTGTPVENSLADLWSLFDFIQPGLLGALNEFGVRYRRPIEAKTDEERARVEELRKLIKPQIIRRTKHEVAKDLPEKVPMDCCIPMSPYQKMLYSDAISQFRSGSQGTGNQRSANHLGLLQYLKRVCSDPRPMGQLAHIADLPKDYTVKSPKMRWLMDQLTKIRSTNEKAIIFTEYRDIQRLIQKYVHDNFQFLPDIINGDTSTSAQSSLNRQKRIDAFQEKPGFGVIILSPLAAGFGLNIQAANHVIHYTRAWNPAKEDQATDRAHRIGQSKTVFVYCPIVTGTTFETFEEKLDKLLDEKRELAKDMLNGSGDVSGADFSGIEDVDGTQVVKDRPITLDDVICMDCDTFEGFCGLLWQKQGYRSVYHTGKRGDGGVDVVALNQNTGDLIQAKTSLKEGKELGWEAIKDVVAGEAGYKAKHPGVTFTKYAITNQFFNAEARYQANVNNVTLLDQHKLHELLRRHPTTTRELERFL
jgi:SNF2 family DNA or RNA helicase